MPLLTPISSSSMGWPTTDPSQSSATPNASYFKIFTAAIIGIIVTPLLVGIYESWRKKQVTHRQVQEVSHSFNPFTLLGLGIHEFRSSHWSSTLETMPISETRKISLEQLSDYQFFLLMSRADFFDDLLTTEQIPRLEKAFKEKYPWDVKELLDQLSNEKLLSLLNLFNFAPFQNRHVFFEILISRPDIVKNLRGEQLFKVYEPNDCDKSFISQLTDHQFLEILKHPSSKTWNFSRRFCKSLVTRPQVVNQLTTLQLFQIYRKLTTQKLREFVNHLTSRQLLTLLESPSLNLDDKVEIFELISDSQIDHVKILAIFILTVSMHLCALYSQKEKSYFYRGDSLPSTKDFVDKVKKKFASVPVPLVRFCFSQLPLDQFGLLFFSENQLHSINFRKVQFATVECHETGSSFRLTLKPTTPQEWLEAVCMLFDPALLEGISSKKDPLGSFFSKGIFKPKLEIDKQLKQLSVKQVAFLLRRTYGMRNHQLISESVFPVHRVGTDFLHYYRHEFVAPVEEDEVLPDASLSEAYQILELKPESSWEEIRAQYKKLSRLHHPDASVDKKKDGESFKKLSEAYKFLEIIMDTP